MSETEQIIETYKQIVIEQRNLIDSLNSIIKTQTDYITRVVGFGESPSWHTTMSNAPTPPNKVTIEPNPKTII